VDSPLEEFTRGLNEGFNGDAEMLMHYYYDAMAEMITIGGFDIVGHIDLLKKNCYGKNYWSLQDEICRQKEIVSAISKAGLITEVNTGGINRGKTRDTFPSLDFLRFLHEYNIPVIITADAHCAKDIDGNYTTAIQTLKDAGYHEHVLFSGKNNGKTTWEKIKIR
jgi:histidinol-phosphatase (PHP family)